jgi:uncharacterized lipoprotein YddW (UPF0748 family)
MPLLLLAGCVRTAEIEPAKPEELRGQGNIKAVFITYYELSNFTKGNDENAFVSTIKDTFSNLKSKGFNRVSVQVRPCADAFYNSEYYPVSEYFQGEQGSELIYDPLEIMCEKAHAVGLSVEAWINPYRVSQDNNTDKMSKDNFALKLKDTEGLILLDSGIYFNPADEKVIKLITDGAAEIAEKYPVDSICFDDYFYPTKDKSIDKKYYKSYKKKGGKLKLSDWRRDNVSRMVKSVYNAVKEKNPAVTFGISPACSIENNYSVLYADVEKWVTESGYVDYICPQVYFGFKNETQPFMKSVKRWYRLADCDLMIALPLYKAGKSDKYAGSGKDEFLKNDDIVSRQVTYISKLKGIKGFYVFSYSSLSDNAECENLYSAMQNS